jgi:hypothetical protein
MLGLQIFLEADGSANSSLNILRTRVWEKNRASAKFRSEDRLLLDLIAYLFKDKKVYQDNKKATSSKKNHGHKLMFSSKLNFNFIQLF